MTNYLELATKCLDKLQSILNEKIEYFLSQLFKRHGECRYMFRALYLQIFYTYLFLVDSLLFSQNTPFLDKNINAFILFNVNKVYFHNILP